MVQQDVLDYIRKTPHNSNVNVVKGMLDSLGGSSLPEVTNEDNGKVLTVVEGEWDKAAGGGGSEAFIIRYNDESEDDSYISNYSFYDLPEENKVPTYYDQGATLYPIQNHGGSYFTWLNVNPISDPEVTVVMFTLDQDDESGTKFTAQTFTASLTFTEDE